MAIDVNRAFNTGLYTPFRGFDRDVGPVGTMSVDVSATGDAGGGTVLINLTMERQEFGFHPIFVPTRCSSLDTLTTAEVVKFLFTGSGNERLKGDVREARLAVAAAGSENIAAFEQLGVSIEPAITGDQVIMQMLWSTNEDGKAYHMHVFGILYDAEALARSKARGKGADQLLGGVR